VNNAYAAGATQRRVRSQRTSNHDSELRQAIEMLPTDAVETLRILGGETDSTIVTVLSTLPLGSRSALEAAQMAYPSSEGSKVWSISERGREAIVFLSAEDEDDDDVVTEQLDARLKAERDKLEQEFGETL
jgi:hypothetical protein